VAQRGVVLFKDVNDAEMSTLVVRDGKAHCIRGAGGRKVLAAAACVTAITELALMVFRRSERYVGLWATKPETRIPQGQPRTVQPRPRIEPPLGVEIWTGHDPYRNRAVSDRRRIPNLSRYPNRLEYTRIDILKKLLEQNPTSTFARYGLAMEYVKAGELETAVAEFKAIAAADPGYSAAYFHGAQTLEKLGRLSDARGFYREGMASTRDEHARSEMQAALEALGPDE
jgi:hypothetical protein